MHWAPCQDLEIQLLTSQQKNLISNVEDRDNASDLLNNS